jgi:thiol-disulfide isomerase/thioredoxin
MQLAWIVPFFALFLLQVVFSDDDQTSLTLEGFQQFLKDERVGVVEYYSPMCGSCKEFAGSWTKIESRYVIHGCGGERERAD